MDKPSDINKLISTNDNMLFTAVQTENLKLIKRLLPVANPKRSLNYILERINSISIGYKQNLLLILYSALLKSPHLSLKDRILFEHYGQARLLQILELIRYKSKSEEESMKNKKLVEYMCTNIFGKPKILQILKSSIAFFNMEVFSVIFDVTRKYSLLNQNDLNDLMIITVTDTGLIDNSVVHQIVLKLLKAGVNPDKCFFKPNNVSLTSLIQGHLKDEPAVKNQSIAAILETISS